MKHLHIIINYIDRDISRLVCEKVGSTLHKNLCLVPYEIWKVEAVSAYFTFYYPKGKNSVQARKRLFDLYEESVITEYQC